MHLDFDDDETPTFTRGRLVRARILVVEDDDRFRTMIGEAGKHGASVLFKPFSLDALCDATIEALLCAR